MRALGLRPAGRGCRRHQGGLLAVLAALMLACGLVPAPAFTPTPASTSVTLPTPIPPPSVLGTSKNPLILALAPATQTTPQVLQAGNQLVGLLEQSTGYTIVSVVPPTEADLVKGFGNGGAHMGVLSPFAYLLASSEGNADAAFARVQDKQIVYGAQFIARADAGFQPFFDPLSKANSADAPHALAQFQDKKPCWTDDQSPSGYVVALGYLSQSHIQTRTPAFLAGHVAVVRAVQAGGICDFGATYVDARTYPGLQDQYPNLLQQVVVIWRIPPIIPYETLAFVHGMDEGMRRSLIRAFVDIESTPDGAGLMQTLYGFDSMQVIQDSQYYDFRRVVKASGLDLNSLVH